MNNHYNNKGYNQNNLNNINNMNGMNFSDMPRETEEYMYPEVYHTFFPITEQVMKEMERQYGDVVLSDDMLQQMTEEAIRRAGVGAAMPTQIPAKDGDAIPTFYDFRDGGSWRGYDRSALSDIARILFLQQIFGRRRPRWRWR
ncbi:MAG: hypothetical protein FWD71_20900 [Oscillospiraceae bacterium]|nr:hypothetical protein [Oscillospiraceae bacterium]